MTFQFDCVFYYVSDLDRAVAFYTGVLGLKLSSRDAVARFDLDGVLLELVPAPDEAGAQGRGNARLCLKHDDLQRALGELQSKGIATSAVQERQGGLLASFQDPDGNEICVWQYR